MFSRGGAIRYFPEKTTNNPKIPVKIYISCFPIQYEVNFHLPVDNIPLLQEPRDFGDFDSQGKILHCDKPGTGSVDAPRAFSLKLKNI